MKIALKTTINDLISTLRVFTLSAADRHARKVTDERDRETRNSRVDQSGNRSP